MNKRVVGLVSLLFACQLFGEEDFFEEADLGETIIVAESSGEVSSNSEEEVSTNETEEDFFENADTNLGETVIVETSEVGSSYENNLNNTSKNLSIITSEDITKSVANTVWDALKNTPSVIAKTGSSNSGIIDIRGEGDSANSNVAIVVDGMKQNPIDLSSVNLREVPANNIEKIEVIPGGSSVLYGDGAVGGVVKITTKKGLKEDSGSLSYERSSYNGDRGRVYYNKNLGDTNLWVNLSGQKSEGYRDNSDYKDFLSEIGVHHQLNERNSLEFSYKHRDGEIDLPGFLQEEEYKNNPRKIGTGYGYTETKGNEYNLKYKYDNDNLRVVNSVLFREDKKKYNYPDPFFPWDGETKYKNIKNNLVIEYETGKNKLIGGIDISQGKVDDGSNWAEKKNFGIYAQNTYSLTDKLDIIAGLRNETIDYDFLSGHSKDYNNLVYETSLNYKYSEKGSVYLSHGKDFRSPVTEELYQASTKVFNEDLKPQTGSNFEIGVKDYIGGAFVSAAVFYKEIEDEIYYDPFTFKNQNYDGDVAKKGFEVNFSKQFDKLNYFGNYSYIDTEVKGGKYKGKEVAGVPNNKFSLGVGYQFTEKLGANLVGNYMGESYAISDKENSSKKVDSYTTADLNLKYEVNDALVFTGGIKNITDEKYSESTVYGYTGNGATGYENVYYPAPERNYYIGVNYKF